MLSGRIPISEALESEGKKVTIGGFVSHVRELKNIVFLVIRDSSGTIQVVFSHKNFEIPGREYVVLVKGIVERKRSGDGYEILGEEISICSQAKAVPIELGEERVSEEKFRMKYRYLDLRRKEVKDNLFKSSEAKFVASKYLHDLNFTEITTPILSFPSKEGAQTFSTLPNSNVSTSFTLAQSPQLYKQLLMIGGFDRYFQFSTSFRAEKLREDRQYEFTQLDIEMSLTHRDKLFEIIEGLIKKIFKECFKHSLPGEKFPKLTYKEAIEKYGTDKPDVRFPPTIKELFKQENIKDKVSEFCFYLFYETSNSLNVEKIFQEAGVRYKYIDHLSHASPFEGDCDDWICHHFSSKNIDSKGFYCFYICSDSSNKDKDLKALGELRSVLANYDSGDWKNKNRYSFVWIVDWPYFEKDIQGELKPTHHPFTKPETNNSENYELWKSKGYDLVLNGCEIASGSERITDPKLQEKIFKILGYSEEEIQENFGWFLEAMQYGTPPHLGIAIGWERLMKELLNLSSIREIIAFPKNSHGLCSMSTHKPNN